MHIYKKFSKAGLSFSLAASVFMVPACGTNLNNINVPHNIINSNNVINRNNTQTTDTFRDWTYNRVDPRIRSMAFSTKSSADSLKIAPGIVNPTEVGLSTSKTLSGRFHTVSACDLGSNQDADITANPALEKVGCNPINTLPSLSALPKIFDSSSILVPTAVGNAPVPEIKLQNKLYLAKDTKIDSDLRVGDSIVVEDTGENFLVKNINGGTTFPYPAGEVLGPDSQVFISDKLSNNAPFPGTIATIKGDFNVTGTKTTFLSSFAPGSSITLNFPGTVTTTSKSSSVAGINTKFKETFQVGDSITINGITKYISAIGSDTTLTTSKFKVDQPTPPLLPPPIPLPLPPVKDADEWPNSLSGQSYALTTIDLPGTVTTTIANNTVIGTNTKFLTTFKVGDYITIDGITKYISAINSDTSLSTSLENGTTDDVWPKSLTSQVYLKPGMSFTVATSSNSNVVTGTNTTFLNSFTPGDTIIINGVSRTVAGVTSDTSMTTTVNWPTTLSGQSLGKMGFKRKVTSVTSDTSLTIDPNGLPWPSTLSGRSYLKPGDVNPLTATTITLDRVPATPITNTNGSNLLIVKNKVLNGTNSSLSGRINTTAGSKTINGTFGTNFTAEIKAGDIITIEKTGEQLTVDTINQDPTASSFTARTAANSTTSNSSFKLSVPKSNRAKSFGVTSLSPLVDTVNNVLYYTADNSNGSNLFAMKANGDALWEQNLTGGFWGNSPTISTKTHLGKRIMYLAGKNGDISVVNTDGVLVATAKVNDTFKDMSLAVDYSDANLDYIYAAGQSGNLYRFKLDFSNSQVKSLSLVYTSKIAETKFSSSPVFDGSSVYLGGENGVLYDIIPNTGQAARSWDLSLYPKNGTAKIIGSPMVGMINAGKVIIVPAGGYLFRIVGSTVTQSPLLELKNGLNSSNNAYGSVFTSNESPTGNIVSSPVGLGSKVYITNGNALFELDYSSIDTFKNSAVYCATVSGRKDDSNTNLLSLGNGRFDISPTSSGDGTFRAVMMDLNTAKNSSPNINFFSVPLAQGTDSLVRFMPVNEFTSNGYPVSGENSSAVADGAGKVYFTFDNGSVNVVPVP